MSKAGILVFPPYQSTSSRLPYVSKWQPCSLIHSDKTKKPVLSIYQENLYLQVKAEFIGFAIALPLFPLAVSSAIPWINSESHNLLSCNFFLNSNLIFFFNLKDLISMFCSKPCNDSLFHWGSFVCLITALCGSWLTLTSSLFSFTFHFLSFSLYLFFPFPKIFFF